MALEHVVYAVPPGEENPVYFASYDLERWQWAQKHAQMLADKGCTEVEVLLEESDDEGENEET